MMKIAIITITENDNFGNRLQNYALQRTLEKFNYKVETIKNISEPYAPSKKKKIIRHFIYFFRFNNLLIKRHSRHLDKIKRKRLNRFLEFDKKYVKFLKGNYISNYDICQRLEKKYDFFIAGSDQIWNTDFKSNGKVNFLAFTSKEKSVSYAASFGVSNVVAERREEIKNYLDNISSISVREDAGKKIVSDLTGRTDVEVLLDPTMLLTNDEWATLTEKSNYKVDKKYILVYFLGNLSNERKQEIINYAEKNNLEIINILDTNDDAYISGPLEFLWLEKNADIIFTDSFHSVIFSIIFRRPFVVYSREQVQMNNMGSRIDTLLEKFDLNDRKYNGALLKDIEIVDYSKTEEVLNEERKKSFFFLKNAIRK